MSALTVIALAGVRAGSPNPPIATVSVNPEFGVLGSVVRLDGRGSSDPSNLPLTYTWIFDQVPIGSMVLTEGFRSLEDDNGLVTFSPDKVGLYVVRLTVSNGLKSSTVTVKTSTRAILVPDGLGIVPDGKFIWSYIRDVWQQVENKEIFETFWSALIQLCGSELLKAYEVDFNKSIRDIQDLAQRRWLSYEPKLTIDSPNTKIIFGNQAAGVGATTEDLGRYAKAIVIGGNELIVVEGSVVSDPQGRISVLYSKDQANVGKYELVGVNAAKTGYRLARSLPNPQGDYITAEPVVFSFTFQSTSWSVGAAGRRHNYAELLAEHPQPVDQLSRIYAPKGTESSFDIRIGDIVHVLKGRNMGLYRISQASGSYITVDHAPPFASDGSPCNVYRPLGIQVTPPARATTNTFAIPYVSGKTDLSTLAAGRVMTVGTQAVTVVRSYIDTRQGVPVMIVVTDEEDIIPEQAGLAWRIPQTLSSTSQDFEALGVSAGDLLTFDVTLEGTNFVVEVKAQVVGVDGGRLGFVLTTEPVLPGVVPDIPDQTLSDLANGFGIDGAVYGYDNVFRLSGQAEQMVDEASSLSFKRTYANREISSYDLLDVLGTRFTVSAFRIVRNHLIPVPDLLRSVPALQEWIEQPQTVQRNGKWYQLRDSQEYEIRGEPLLLAENQDYVIDGQVAYEGELSFKLGSNIVEMQGASFFDKGLEPGDTLRIESPPALAGDYLISAVTGQDQVTLPVVLAGHGVVTVRAKILRRRVGQFIRIVPGAFTAKSPISGRMWAEVSYFDNSPAIEGNFGILVGLTKADLEKVSSNLSYRQAVAGLMYAYTRGSAVNKIRLGAQILLGLPFAEHRGIVRSVDDDYRLGANRTPVEGRLLIEDVDKTGMPLGTLRVYTYPIDPTSDLAGLETNPTTKKLYVVGDMVELFAPLSKGVEVSDYLTGSQSFQSAKQILRQFHSFRLRANDSIFSLAEMSLVSDFLRRITPSAVSFVILSTAEYRDSVTISDHISFKIAFGGATSALEDNISLGIPTALLWDFTTVAGRGALYWDGAFRIVRSGRDLSIAGGVITVESAGLVISPTGHGVLGKIGDRLAIGEGVNKGTYEIGTITDDTIELVDPPYLEDGGPLAFTVLRKITGELRRGQYTADGGTAHLLEDGLEVDLVMPGDWFVTSKATKHIIISVDDTQTVTVQPELGAPDGPANYRIYRPGFIESPLQSETATLTSDGDIYGDFDNPFLEAMAEPLDELEVSGEDGVTIRLLIIDLPVLVIQPILPAGEYTVRLCKQGRPPDSISFDHLDRNNPADWCELQVGNDPNDPESPQLALTSGERGVLFDLTLNPQVGDFLLIKTGDGAEADIGYGAGRIPVAALSATGIVLSHSPSATESVDWALCRTRPPRQPKFTGEMLAPTITEPTEDSTYTVGGDLPS